MVELKLELDADLETLGVSNGSWNGIYRGMICVACDLACDQPWKSEGHERFIGMVLEQPGGKPLAECYAGNLETVRRMLMAAADAHAGEEVS